MSLQPFESYQVPEGTARVAQAIFPEDNLAMRIRDKLGLLVSGHDFDDNPHARFANKVVLQEGSNGATPSRRSLSGFTVELSCARQLHLWDFNFTPE